MKKSKKVSQNAAGVETVPKDESPRRITVFYSWQSDLPNETNCNAIRSSLKKSIATIQESLPLANITYDEATRDEPGSPDIAVTILSKISRADIFVCDISIINSSDDKNRHTPNPNVLIELGYAVAMLGWERIILLFNNHYGDLRSDSPFDIRGRRISSFTIKDEADTSGKGALAKSVLDGLKLAIENNPGNPSEEAMNPDAIKRKRDIENIKEVLSRIHIATMEMFIKALPNIVIHEVFFYWESVRARLESSYIHFYDKVLDEKMTALYESWGNSLSFGEYYGNSPNGNHYIPNFEGDREVAEKVEVAAIKLARDFRGLVRYVRENFVEVDVNELSQQASIANADLDREFNESIGIVID